MKKSGMLTRVISGAVLVVILLIVGILGSWPILAVTLFVSIVGLSELYTVLGIYDKNTKGIDNILFYIAAVMSVVYFAALAVADKISSPTERERIAVSMIIMLAFVVIMLVIFMGIYVFTFPRFNVEKIAYAFLGAIYVPVFMSCTYLTRCLENGIFVFWLVFIASWICDTCAYFVGVSIGKHRLAPILSPKKSIEGSIGGIAGSILVAFIYGYFIEYKLCGGANHATSYMIICGLGAIVSQIGDLAASAIKRNRDIKDYGTLIPGHGGIMDRFDSVIFVAPAIYLLAAVLF